MAAHKLPRRPRMSARRSKKLRKQSKARPDKDRKRLMAAVRAFPVTHPYCLLCGGQTEFVGVFVPYDPLSVSTPVGKRRYVLYPLCSACHGKPETAETVEDIISVELGPHATAINEAVMQ